MAEVIYMPKMSDTMEQGVLVKWLKKVGDTVTSGDVLAEVETDKAVMELENYEEGTLLYIAVHEGNAVPVDALIAVVGNKGEDITALVNVERKKVAVSTSVAQEGALSPQVRPTVLTENPAAEATSSVSAKGSEEHTPLHASTERLKASPLARKMADAKGYSLQHMVGSGDGGRIIKRDVLQYTPTSSTSLAEHDSYTEVPVSQMRQTIATRLSESKFTAPHFYLCMEAEVSQLAIARARMNTQGLHKISFNDLIVKASAQALVEHPVINSSWQGHSIRQYRSIHIGVAVAIPDGLLVPVLHFANTKGLVALSTEMKVLAQQARDRTLTPEQWAGSTFSISNLGMYGIENFTAIINAPNACILAVGGIHDKPIVRDGAVVPGKCLQFTLSCDHRVVDGASGAAFLKTVKAMLEDPVQMLL